VIHYLKKMQCFFHFLKRSMFGETRIPPDSGNIRNSVGGGEGPLVETLFENCGRWDCSMFL